MRNVRDLMTKWLCIEWPAGLCRRSCSLAELNGTLPITRSKWPSGSRVSAKDSHRISASGYNLAAIAAVTGSSSTPSTCAPGGARPMKLPTAAAGSSTCPPSNPSAVTWPQTHFRQRGVGVVRVDRGPPRRRVFGLGQELAQVGAGRGELLPVVIEDLRDRSPP